MTCTHDGTGYEHFTKNDYIGVADLIMICRFDMSIAVSPTPEGRSPYLGPWGLTLLVQYDRNMVSIAYVKL